MFLKISGSFHGNIWIDSFGILQGIASFVTLAESAGICIAVSEKILRRAEDADYDRIIERLSQKSSARGVVMFADEDETRYHYWCLSFKTLHRPVMDVTGTSFVNFSLFIGSFFILGGAFVLWVSDEWSADGNNTLHDGTIQILEEEKKKKYYMMK